MNTKETINLHNYRNGLPKFLYRISKSAPISTSVDSKFIPVAFLIVAKRSEKSSSSTRPVVLVLTSNQTSLPSAPIPSVCGQAESPRSEKSPSNRQRQSATDEFEISLRATAPTPRKITFPRISARGWGINIIEATACSG